MNNTEFVTNLMEFSNQGALIQAFVIEALRWYSESTLTAESWPEPSFINQEAWRKCAQECLKKLEENYGI